MCGCEPGFVCTRCAGTSADPWWWLDDSPLLPDVYRHAVAVLGPDRFARRYQIKVPA